MRPKVDRAICYYALRVDHTGNIYLSGPNASRNLQFLNLSLPGNLNLLSSHLTPGRQVPGPDLFSHLQALRVHRAINIEIGTRGVGSNADIAVGVDIRASRETP